MQELERQTEKKQEAFQKLAPELGYVEPMETNMGSLRTPLASYQQALDAAEAATRQGVETFQKAAQQAEKARE
jgi:chromosome condensin MukBEF ATPase and DNA-binding subunit MukB